MIKPARPFQFAVTARHAPDLASWVAIATRTEELGYSGFGMGDHIGGRMEAFGIYSALTAAALAAPKLRVFPHVLANDFRNPVLTVRELATLDVLSGGRVVAGIGAGWLAEDYAATGVTRDRESVKIARLAEAVQVMKKLFAGGSVEFEGEFYKVSISGGQLAALQLPHPPFLMGGGGRRMLTLAAQEADIVSIVSSGASGRLDASALESWLPAAVDERVEWIAEAAGRRFADLDLSTTLMLVAVTDEPVAALAATGNFGLPLAELGVAESQARRMPSVAVGSLDEIVAMLLERRERWGFNHYVVPVASMEAFAPVVARLAGC